VRSSPERIRHIPHVLYHWRSIHGSTAAATGNKDYAVKAALKALSDRYPDCTVSEGLFPTTYRVRHPLPAEPPLVSLIIPTRDGYALIEQAVRTILEKTTYPRFEILIIDNQSTDPRTLQYFEELQQRKQARVIRYDAPFNFSVVNNLGVREARGEVVGLINNDVDVIEPEWLTELVSQAIRPEIGAVGCKLLYPDDTIQHAGVILGLFGVAGHVFRQIPRNAPGYFSRAQLVQDLSCCTAACLVLRKKVYQEVGGLDEQNLRVAFNDVDFCMRIAKAGYRNLYTPYALLYHHESASRGFEDTPEKQARFQREVLFMKERWGAALEQDPAYNPNLSLTSLQMEFAWPPRARRPWKA
jgi:GT2 family glycosyltransferase